MIKIRPDIALTFDDVMLVPCFSKIDSRFDGSIDLSTTLGNIKLKYPIISANMDTVTTGTMAQAMYLWGGTGIPHRFMTPREQAIELSLVTGPRIACIGVGNSSRERLDIITSFVGLDGVLIDIAHGHCSAMCEQILWVRTNYPRLTIIAGNVATKKGALDLIEAGANVIKIGVGPGSLCTTRVKTGNGVPQLTAISDVADAIEELDTPVWLIADGGIRSSGDIIKALAAGADAVMVGSLLAGTDETPGDIYTYIDGHKATKIYRGMASKDAQKSWKGYATSVEGESKTVPCRGPVKDVLDDLLAGILSGMSYQNARNIHELQMNCEFIRQTYYGHKEGLPHGLL